MINFTQKTFISIDYHKPNENLFPEDYAHHILLFYYTIFKESDLKLNNSYLLKINGPGVLNIVNRNGEIFEVAPDIVDHYWVLIGKCSILEGQLRRYRGNC